MKVGLYLSDTKPEDGGANSLLGTIRNEVKVDSGLKNVEFVYIYSGRLLAPYKQKIDGNYYINIKKIHIVKNIILKILHLKYEDVRLNVIAKKENIDLFWFPFPCKFICDYPYIYTVWDLGHRRTPYFPEVSRSGWLWREREDTYQSMLYKASYVVTGNEEGKKEILENYPMPPKKIRISSFPVASFCYKQEKKPNFVGEELFFFYPAQFWPHKNHIIILDAIEILKSKYNLHPNVYFCGSEKGNKKYIESEIIKRNLSTQVKITGFVLDEELKYLYTHAVGMIFASLMGPNNMPPIEGTYLNCPVIITDLDGHKEQLQESALYFNGYNPDALAEQMMILMTNYEYRNEIKMKEKKLAEEFSKANYFSEIKKIIEEFSCIRRTWDSVQSCSQFDIKKIIGFPFCHAAVFNNACCLTSDSALI